VAAVSEADRESLPARLADRAVCIGRAHAAESYLKIEAIIAAALGTDADAVHPGYGFLAEEPELAEACAKHGLTSIGPRPENIRQMGNKLQAREMAESYGIPVVSGSTKIRSFMAAARAAEELGFPILIKAAAGGGGRGIKIVRHQRDLKSAFETAAAEARAAFANETLYMERYISNARHIEVQILADQVGHVIHVGERDCSLQRRYQKVVEEAPAYSLTGRLRQKILKAGVTIAGKMRYENAGTVEFILDQDSGRFYFLEMNTRIQVEHPVTEMMTGLDLVQEQIRIANGQPLSVSQAGLQFSGHAIECRINAESPHHGFRPCPGLIAEWSPPEGPGIRVDSHCYAGYFVPPYYDSLLGKLITHGSSRQEAIDKMSQGLEGFKVSGIDTTIPFLRFLINRHGYVQGEVSTRWVERELEKFSP